MNHSTQSLGLSKHKFFLLVGLIAIYLSACGSAESAFVGRWENQPKPTPTPTVTPIPTATPTPSGDALKDYQNSQRDLIGSLSELFSKKPKDNASPNENVSPSDQCAAFFATVEFFRDGAVSIDGVGGKYKVIEENVLRLEIGSTPMVLVYNYNLSEDTLTLTSRDALPVQNTAPCSSTYLRATALTTLDPQTNTNEQSLDWQAIDGEWSQIEQGVLVGESDWEARYVASPGASWQDYIFTGQLKFPESQELTEIALLFHIQDIRANVEKEQDQGRYYQISLIPQLSNILLFRIADGTNEEIQKISYNFNTDQWYQFRVELNNSMMTFFVNDERVLEQNGLTAYSSGGIGVKTFWGSTGYFKELHLQLK